MPQRRFHVDPEKASMALAEHALETALQLIGSASPYLFHRLLGMPTNETLMVDEMNEIRALAKERVRQVMQVVDTDFPRDWDRVLKAMAGDFTAEEWAKKIGMSPQVIEDRCRLFGVQPQRSGKT